MHPIIWYLFIIMLPFPYKKNQVCSFEWDVGRTWMECEVGWSGGFSGIYDNGVERSMQ